MCLKINTFTLNFTVKLMEKEGGVRKPDLDKSKSIYVNVLVKAFFLKFSVPERDNGPDLTPTH